MMNHIPEWRRVDQKDDLKRLLAIGGIGSAAAIGAKFLAKVLASAFL